MRGETNGGHGGLLASLLLLTFTTGLVDAASFLGLGHVFTGNMTGNVVLLGFGLVGTRDVWIPGNLVGLALFLVGAGSVGRLVQARRRTLPGVLGVELILLSAAAIVSASAAAHTPAARFTVLGLLAASMGVQSAAARRLAIPDMTTTVLTLTLTGLAADSSLAGGTNPRLRRRVGAVLSMLAGALVGALLMRGGLAWTIAAAAIVDAAAVAGLWSSRQANEAFLARGEARS